MDPAALGRVSVWFGDSWCTARNHLIWM